MSRQGGGGELEASFAKRKVYGNKQEKQEWKWLLKVVLHKRWSTCIQYIFDLRYTTTV
jgi:predicted SprT family Zn-dependent metalloprotease